MTREEFLGAYNIGHRDGKEGDYLPNDYDDMFHIEESKAEQEPKTGHWQYADYMDEWWGRVYICSECGERMIGQSNYCHNCGARMSEVEQ